MSQEQPKQPNIYRDTILRYAAFANDFGEVLRGTMVSKFGPVVGNRAANFSHLITVSYAAGDIYQTYSRQPDKELAFREAKDCAVWQLFASVLITPILLKGGCVGLTRLLRNRAVSQGVKTYLPPALSLSTIPVVVPYVDQKVDDLMNVYYRDVPKHRH